MWALDRLPADLDVEREAALDTPGIGPGIASLIEEFRDTGTLRALESLAGRYPLDSGRLRRLPRMTPKRLRQLKTEIGVDTADDLLAAIDTGDALTLSGVGESTLALWEDILSLAPEDKAWPAFRAWVVAADLANHIERLAGGRALVAGEVRRVEEWVSSLDLVVATQDPSPVTDLLATSAVLADGDADGFTTHSGIPGRVHITAPDSLGETLLVATGPEEHVQSLGAPEAGPSPNEETAYQRRGLQWVPPPARGLSYEQAVGVVRLEDIRGDFHLHSVRSPDGRMELDTIAALGVELGYEYILISDHTIGLRFGGLGPDDLAAQREEIERLRPRYPSLTIFQGAEVNIDKEGGLDLDDDTLDSLDFVVAGMHSHFGLDESEQTARIVRALAHPKVRVLAHPTGRRIGTRPAVRLDLHAVFEAAVANDRALEANGHRDRLDLSSHWVRIAAGMGARFAADSDGHRVDEVVNIANGVATLQAAGVPADQVVNTMPLAEMMAWAVGSGDRS